MQMPEPAATGRWILGGYAGVVAMYNFWNADALDVVALGIVFLPWLVGPAAVAARFAKRSRAKWASWAFIAIEVAVVCSTATLWIDLIMHPDAQNGIAMMFFPALQFAGVFAAAFAIKIVSLALAWRYAAASDLRR